MLRVNNVTKSFGNKMVLTELSFEIDQGEKVAIIGESGRGKTTLLNIIGLIEKPTSGTIDLCGFENVKVNSKQSRVLYRDHIGYLFQNFALLDNETVMQNFKVAIHSKAFRYIAKEKIAKVLKNVGLENYENKKVYNLSGGEQQRVALARLMLKPCDIVLADEPTGSLDVKNRDRVLEHLDQLNREGKTIIIVTHDSYVANWCDRIIEL
ncbi:MAG: ABC transporter ATP-binding protein [Culicoidibacterales bacterium]